MRSCACRLFSRRPHRQSRQSPPPTWRPCSGPRNSPRSKEAAMASHHKHHMKRKQGGRTEYNAKGSNVMEEAHEKKRGGAAFKHGGKVHGHKGHHRIHKKRGGSVDKKGADDHPFSSAYTAASEAE